MSTDKAIEEFLDRVLELKTGWLDGPWDEEPDRVEWREHGLVCLISRSEVTGALCGYVGVPREHLHYGKGWDDVNVDVHGGLTYASPCSGHICHVPKPGETEDVWWFGFDCAHAFDLMPALKTALQYATMGLPEMKDPYPSVGGDPYCDTYRDLAYVTAEVSRLAAQLARIQRVKQMR
jgi:hypothetical protein